METIKAFVKTMNNEYWFWMGLMTILAIVSLVIWITNGVWVSLKWNALFTAVSYAAISIRFKSWTAFFTGAWAYDCVKK